MKKHTTFYYIIVLICFSAFNLIGQTDGLTKTTEYSGKKKRRDMFLNKDMNVVQESYYSEEFEQIINTIYYDNSGKLLRLIGYENYPKVTFDINFSKGTYEIPQSNTILKFKNRFVFDGLQKGDNIVVNYSNGIRQGRLIQTDSAEYGTKTVVYQRPNIRLLSRFNILQFYNEIGEEDTYKVYKGLILNFSNDKLNGRQLGYFVNGASKIKADFSKGKVLNYSSFNQEGSTLSNISADSNAIVKKPYILNGIIEREKLNVSFSNNQLNKTGLINFENDFLYEEGGWNDYRNFEFDKERQLKDDYYVNTLALIEGIYGSGVESNFKNFHEFFNSKKINLKKWFDGEKLMVIGNNPHILRVLFGIPFFNIDRFDFENKDQTDLEIIEN